MENRNLIILILRLIASGVAQWSVFDPLLSIIYISVILSFQMDKTETTDNYYVKHPSIENHLISDRLLLSEICI